MPFYLCRAGPCVHADRAVCFLIAPILYAGIWCRAGPALACGDPFGLAQGQA